MRDTHTAMTFTIRPFERVLEIGEGVRKVSGQIRDGRFVLSLDASDFDLPTESCGTDENGPFARIAEGERVVGHGFILRVEPEVSFDPEIETEPLPPDCRIAVFRPSSDMREALLQQGIDPDAVHVVSPSEASFSVYFTEGGHLCGWVGSSYAAEASGRDTQH